MVVESPYLDLREALDETTLLFFSFLSFFFFVAQLQTKMAEEQ
jgi:hypothetical protein